MIGKCKKNYFTCVIRLTGGPAYIINILSPKIKISACLNMKPLSRLEIFALSVIFIFFTNCTGKYFKPSARPPFSPNYRTLSQLPYSEYWTGLVFNGKRIGFSFFSLTPSDEKNGLYDIRSEAYLHIRFLMFDKKIKLESFDQVVPDFFDSWLVSFFFSPVVISYSQISSSPDSSDT